MPGTPCLIAATERAKLNDSLDLLQEAGEDVPPQLYRRGSLQRITDAARGATAGVSVARLVADIDQVLAWFDPEPSAQGPDVSSEHPRPGTAADSRT